MKILVVTILPFTLFTFISCNSQDTYYDGSTRLKEQISELTKRVDELEYIESFHIKKLDIRSLIEDKNVEDANSNFELLKSNYTSDSFNADIKQLEKEINDLSLYVECVKSNDLDTINHYLEHYEHYGRYFSEIKEIRNKIEKNQFEELLNDFTSEDLQNYLAAFNNGIYYDSVLKIYFDVFYLELTRKFDDYSSNGSNSNKGTTHNSIQKSKGYGSTGYNSPSEFINTDIPSVVFPKNNSSSYTPSIYVNPNANPAQIYIEPYVRKNGTYVSGHYRTKPNYTKTDNLRYPY